MARVSLVQAHVSSCFGDLEKQVWEKCKIWLVTSIASRLSAGTPFRSIREVSCVDKYAIYFSVKYLLSWFNSRIFLVRSGLCWRPKVRCGKSGFGSWIIPFLFFNIPSCCLNYNVDYSSFSRMRSEGFSFYTLGVWGWRCVRWTPLSCPRTVATGRLRESSLCL